MKKSPFLLGVIFFVSSFFIFPSSVLAAKSPTPRITEIAGIHTSNIRAHFQLKPVTAGQIIKVKYRLKTAKFNDVKYKIPKSARQSGIANAASSATGSTIDLRGLKPSIGKFIYNLKVKVKVPGKKWSSWSNTYSM